ncbi:MAG: methylglutamate dehydrogenase subunit [Hyphomicrobiales bacterium]|jgi:sarcosine oxidase subunit gamma|nr:methylglutamate dehydrogenase subunit [Hyphomicrobiales bacterium]
MPDAVLQARSPLHGLARSGHHGRAGPAGLTIVERTDIAFASVIARRGQRDALASAVRASFGLALPDGPRRVGKDGVAFAGIGPGQWIASGENAGDLAASLRERIGAFAAVADQSDSRLVLHLSGARVRDALVKGVPIDLHPRAFKTGDVASTLVAHVGVQIDMLDDAPVFQLTAPRSMAGSFWSWLTASAAEFGYDVATK